VSTSLVGDNWDFPYGIRRTHPQASRRREHLVGAFLSQEVGWFLKQDGCCVAIPETISVTDGVLTVPSGVHVHIFYSLADGERSGSWQFPRKILGIRLELECVHGVEPLVRAVSKLPDACGDILSIRRSSVQDTARVQGKELPQQGSLTDRILQATRCCCPPHPLIMSTKSNIDVLVVGAGPAGLMCANGLARAGVNVRVVDQR